MRVRFYVDGLNFFYNVADVIDFRWVDLDLCLRRAIARHLRTEVETEKMTIFASPEQASQAVYYNALQKHSSCIVVESGSFTKSRKRGQLRDNCPHCNKGQGDTVRILVREEKQTDVNLATAMVRDAYEESDQFDIACLVSNDSDLSSALTIKKALKQRTILLTPLVRGYDRNTGPAKRLRKELLEPDKNHIKHLIEKEIRECALPDVVGGKYQMPAEWRGS